MLWSTMLLKAAYLVLGVFGTELACASPLTPFRTALAEDCLGRMAPGPNFCDIGHDEVIATSGLASVNDSFGFAAIQATLSAKSMANASFGVLDASSSAQFNIAGVAGHAFGNANASFLDIITIDFAPLTGSQGILFVQYTLDGDATSSGVGKAFGGVTVEVITNLQQVYQTAFTGHVSGLFLIPQSFTFIYGQPFSLSFALSAGSGTLLSAETVCISCLGSGYGTANFFNTLVLSGLTVEDQNGNPVLGATFSSASGTQYGPNGVIIPEPSTFALFILSGFVILGRLSIWQLRFAAPASSASRRPLAPR